ncbi:hypothetical protein WDZ17_11530 [Pseudokineococcus basanitobsidens]|uniref:Glycoside hydrolase family 15 n=1 Tax=Pseudokineococcus basanitobsidens TaxID=1926649 RepID=A0ABU8RLH0_9ACTN
MPPRRRGPRARRLVAAAVGLGLLAGCAPTRAAPVPVATGGLLNDESWHDHAAVPGGRTPPGLVPGADGPFADMGADALLDLRRLTQDDGATLAGPVGIWRYSWPRDAAFAAAALAVTGHDDEAARVLGFMQDAQSPDGSFEARYTLDGAGPPDDRPRQDDGAGWLLWSADVATRCPAGTPVQALRPLVVRGTDHLLALTDGGRRLPPPSPDYWEVEESRTTLGSAAPVLAGLQAGQRLLGRLGEVERAQAAGAAADRLELEVAAAFAPRGYQRYATGGGHDAATAMLLPPFVEGGDVDGVRAALEDYATTALRPAGGLAPGAGWKQDGTSWTPEVALVALASAHVGDEAGARRWLAWLDAHRTGWGSLPEKVRADGSPAGPAPLGWTAAGVVLTLAELDDAPRC